MEHVAGPGLAAIPRRQLAQVQLKLFPDWPDDRRGAAEHGHPAPPSSTYVAAAALDDDPPLARRDRRVALIVDSAQIPLPAFVHDATDAKYGNPKPYTG